ncbi:protein phosphatase 1 regulatory subunit 36 isoform X1 [Denticeps clupeoides]|uniref:protein phosphatase 1 regulatory subunit 36 isoform X1 n=1 Tax=Denticeps clupeoides TaxID=299321 RepID=UPI0010A3F5FA|nr:protein phosphatase 1 regulatory subunit 36 isoform X1 [Denticeps clupeoides]XP_028820047.1 protein phosphatase 1 regulatory subunit 36 isoform X1 [Denticeps clupeoides]
MSSSGRRSPRSGRRHGTRPTVGFAQSRACRASEERSQRDHVTLEDVKQVALHLLHKNDKPSVPRYILSVINTEEVDGILAALLLYLSYYFEMTSQHASDDPLMAEQSLTDMQVMADIAVKMELARKQLGLCYSRLILGQGFNQMHHMARGRTGVSSTYKGRYLYECLYSFFCYVAWVTFERKDLKAIQMEVGRLFFSDMFNPALMADGVKDHQSEPTDSATRFRIRNGPFRRICLYGDAVPYSPRLSWLLSSRRLQRRPNLSQILSQRSTVMVSLLPSPRENAPHLFQRIPSRSRVPVKQQPEQALVDQVNEELATLRFGILGKPLNQFSHTGLVPQAMEDKDGDIQESKTSFVSRPRSSGTLDKHSDLSRANTAISRATTEAPASDTE